MNEAEVEVKTRRRMKLRYNSRRHRWYIVDIKTNERLAVTPAKMTAILEFINWVKGVEEIEQKREGEGR